MRSLGSTRSWLLAATVLAATGARAQEAIQDATRQADCRGRRRELCGDLRALAERESRDKQLPAVCMALLDVDPTSGCGGDRRALHSRVTRELRLHHPDRGDRRRRPVRRR